jgi:hypothetical protein
LLAFGLIGVAFISAGLACSAAIQDFGDCGWRRFGTVKSYNLFAIKDTSGQTIKKAACNRRLYY